MTLASRSSSAFPGGSYHVDFFDDLVGRVLGMGEPASPADLRRYVVTTTLVGLGLWVLVNLIGNHWLGR